MFRLITDRSLIIKIIASHYVNLDFSLYRKRTYCGTTKEKYFILVSVEREKKYITK